MRTGPDEDVRAIDVNKMKSVEQIFETDDVVFLSYQPGTAEFLKINPIIRKGIVSQIKNDNTFLIDGSAYPGNSGSPLFHKSTSLTKTTSEVPPNELPKIIGIVGAYIPYQDKAISTQTKRTRIIFEENTGLSICWPTNFIVEIIESKNFQKFIKKIKKVKEEDIVAETFSYSEVN